MDKDERKKHIKLIKNEPLEKPTTKSKKKPKRKRRRFAGEEPIEWEILIAGNVGYVLADRASPFELKMKLVAAYKSYEAGFKSVDYTLKKYGGAWGTSLIKGCWDEDEYEERDGRIVRKQT